MRNQRGITLVALVITIVVLLILAMVSIAMLVGEDGMLITSKETQMVTTEKDNKKIVELAVSDLLTEQHAEGDAETNVTNDTTTPSTLEINAEELETAINRTSSEPGINSVIVDTLDIAEDEVDTPVSVIKVDFIEGEDIYVMPTTGEIVTAKSAQ